MENEISLDPGVGNGMNVAIKRTVHCIAAEPHATFLRVGIADGREEVAYETAVLGRLRRGYRVLQLRSQLGTRIELCYLFVRIIFGSMPNTRGTPRQVTTGAQHYVCFTTGCPSQLDHLQSHCPL